MKKTKKETISEEKYTKSQIVNSKIYISNRDLLNAVLRENKKYTKIEIDEIIKNYYKNLIENERDKLVLLDGRTINLFEDIFNEKHTNNTNTERTGNTEADSEKRWEQSMRSYKKYKLESNIKKEYEKLKRRMKYPVHYVRHIIANIGPFGMIICTTGLWSLSEKGLTDHSWIVLAFIIGEVIGMIITIYNIGYVGEY